LPSQPLTLSTENAIEAVLVTAFLWRSEDARSNAGPPRKLRVDGMVGTEWRGAAGGAQAA
jgi:hypothetical protein